MPTEYRVVAIYPGGYTGQRGAVALDREEAEQIRERSAEMAERLGEDVRVELQSREVGEWQAVESTEEP